MANSIYAIEDYDNYDNGIGETELDLETFALSAVACEQNEFQITTLMSGAIALENYHGAVTSIYKTDGGLDKNAAMMLKLGLAGLGAQLGGEKYGQAFGESVPALESFSMAGGKQTETTFALERIHHRIVNMWKHIMEKIMEWVQKIVNFFNEHLGTTARLASAAKSLKAKAENAGDSKTDSSYKIGVTQLTNLSVEKSHEPAKVINGLGYLGEVISASGKSVITEEIVDSLETNLKELDFKDADAFKISIGKIKSTDAKSVGALLSSAMDKGKFKLVDVTGDSRFTAATDAINGGGVSAQKLDKSILGNKGYFVQTFFAKNSTNAQESLERIKMGLLDYAPGLASTEKEHGNNDKSIEYLSKGDIVSFCTAIIDVADVITESKKDMMKVTKKANETMKLVKTLKPQLDKLKAEIDAADWQYVHNLLIGLTMSITSLYEPQRSLQQQAIWSAKAAYDHASRSYSNLKK